MTNGRRVPPRLHNPILSASVGLMFISILTLPGSQGPAGASIVPTTPLRQQGPGLTKILVIMEENHSIGQVFPSQMPYLWTLARQYGRATSWSDISHPSLPNYLAIFGGSAFNDPQDCLPAAGCRYPGSSVFGQAVAHGGSARAYQESMPSPCDMSDSGEYDVNHNPWAYFPDESRLCRQNDVPAGNTRAGPFVRDVRSGSLPSVGEISPNLVHDGHDGTLAQADAWLRSWVPVLTSGPDWRAGRLAIVVVFDEGETTEQVPFVILAPGVSHRVIRQPLNHFALTRLIDEVVGVPPLREAAHATDLVPVLGLHL
jgi:phosphatidylinositol-3-phosphatase